ncbi:sulfatase-like hydrolase/transferase [Paenibacillus cremeus]|uniref:Sulfatase-like hydrolase/transferase n=1 Tax=Paenibacillus cremeus TaxID=2163881 RepID=A0A559KFR6_9BACL|nr:sulfatase-like hydrolase/transferase [Paenibacillus cremeus]TVY10970.1 sulfatase-like hydrolase/transferase [Paenibacillus cremeus]
MKHSANKKPNIVFLIADDHRFDSLGAYGNPDVQTPALDRLAVDGVLFKSIYTMGGQTAALCVPSRASLMTGANVFKATVSDREVTLKETENRELWKLNPELTTLPEALRRDGYRTYGIGKWHNGAESFARSFTGGASIFFGGMGDHIGLPIHDFDPSGVYPAEAAYPSKAFSSELFADSAIKIIEGEGEKGQEQDEPFFLYLAFTAPHDPRTPPPSFLDLYPPEQIPLPDNFMPEHPFDNGELHVRDEQLASLPRKPEEIQQQLAEYYSMITHMDAQIGRIMEALEASGQLDHTIVVYTADHGIALGQHGLLGKQNLYEHSIHIPLLMQGPGLPRGMQVSGLGHQMDIYPTLCELIGTACPDTVEGSSLVPLLENSFSVVRESVFSAYKLAQRMVSDGRWKLIRYYRSGEVGTDRTQLFDLQGDPWETRSLAEDPETQAQLSQLDKELIRWQLRVQDPILQRIHP